MPSDAAEVVHLLSDTPLASRDVEPLPVPDTEDVAYVVRCAPGEALAAWRAARSVVDGTGRWPVVLAWLDSRSGRDLLNRFFFGHAGLDTSVGAILGRAASMDAATVFANLAAERDAEPDADPGDWLGGDLDLGDRAVDVLLSAITDFPRCGEVPLT